MERRGFIALGIAVVAGLFAVFLANAYFSGVETRQAAMADRQRLARIAIASQNVGFGSRLTRQNVRLANWPAGSVPAGAFTSVDDATRGRVALRPIVVGEPVLASKVSGANGRATLSANLPVGKLAYSIPISEVAGVGGFVRPGDSVDVLLTRSIPGDGANGNDKMTDVVLEAVPVLGIDQISDENKTDPSVGKSATVQVDTLGAQKLALASQLGVLSLALRNVADQVVGNRGTVTPRDVSASNLYIGARRGAPTQALPTAMARVPAIRTPLAPPLFRAPRISGPSMTIVRGTKTSEYEVMRGL